MLDDGLSVGVDAGAPAEDPTEVSEWLWSEAAGGNDLAQQRWGLVAPAGPAGSRLLDAITPLRRWREDEQDAAAPVHRLTAPMDAADAMRWKRCYVRRDHDLDRELPRYWLILGDLDQISASVQRALASDGFCGRLAFDSVDGYRAYADKVLRWERRAADSAELGSPESRPLASSADALLHTVHDGTAASVSGYRALMAPGLEILRQRWQRGHVRARALCALGDIGSARGTVREFLQIAAEDWPRVVLSHAHGEGAPRAGWRSTALQRRYQGAVSFGGGARLSGREVADGRFLPGGVWILLACFGAGTPTESGYRAWLEELYRVGHVGREFAAVFDTLAREQPFIAALPKAALANPDGPLGFIGHIDLAWTYSFMDLGLGAPHERPGRFMNVMQSLLAGDRLGVAYRALFRALGEVNTELSTLMERARRGRVWSRRERAQRAHLWMSRQDLAGYVLLGDPAARLALGEIADDRDDERP